MQMNGWKRTNLDFVILQPVTLTNDEEVTSIQLTKPNEKASKRSLALQLLLYLPL